MDIGNCLAVKPKFPLMTTKNFLRPQPASFASSLEGFNIQINILSMAPAQLLNFTSLTFSNSSAIFNWAISDDGYSILNSSNVFTTLTTAHILSYIDKWESLYFAMMSYGEPPVK